MRIPVGISILKSGKRIEINMKILYNKYKEEVWNYVEIYCSF